ncbi:hypothetical protein [Streptodolium elevatio]
MNRPSCSAAGGVPEGLTVAEVRRIQSPPGVQCEYVRGGTSVTCDSVVPFGPGQGFIVEITVFVAPDAPCTVTNTARFFTSLDFVAANDPTNIPGPGCTTGNGGGTSILPLDLSGLLPFYNNINTGSNNFSPGVATNNTQNFAVSPSP